MTRRHGRQRRDPRGSREEEEEKKEARPPTSDLVMGVLTTNQETVSDFIRGRRMPFCKAPRCYARGWTAVA